MTLLFGHLIDLLLAVSLTVLAWRLLATSDPFKATVLFIAFGLLMALAWVRLDAPDLALAEAVIGAGITGVLLLTALRHLDSGARVARMSGRSGRRSLRVLLPALGIMPALLVLLCLSSPHIRSTAGLTASVIERLDQIGTDHPVTAVLLDFRAYDTLLETAVLLLAVVAVWSLHPVRPIFSPEPISPAQRGLLRLLLPVLIMTSLYLLWRGSHAPGGAFQAGALLAAGLLLLLLSEQRLPGRWSGMFLRLLLAGGFMIFLLVAAGALVGTGTLLDYPGGGASWLLLSIEAALSLSIAALLATAVIGGRPSDRSTEFPPRRKDPAGEEG